MNMIMWFVVILAADLCAAFSFHYWTTRPKKKRKYTRRRSAKVIPFRKAD